MVAYTFVSSCLNFSLLFPWIQNCYELKSIGQKIFEPKTFPVVSLLSPMFVLDKKNRFSIYCTRQTTTHNPFFFSKHVFFTVKTVLVFFGSNLGHRKR